MLYIVQLCLLIVCRCSAMLTLDKKKGGHTYNHNYDIRKVLKPGIHAIMSLDESIHPTTIKLNNENDKKPLFRVVLFYWPVKDAFEVKSKCSDFGAGIDRSNVSSLYVRVLHEICNCVVIESTINEVELLFSVLFCFSFLR